MRGAQRRVGHIGGKRIGVAGEEKSRAYAWDAINQTVADTYLRLIEARKGRRSA